MSDIGTEHKEHNKLEYLFTFSYNKIQYICMYGSEIKSHQVLLVAYTQLVFQYSCCLNDLSKRVLLLIKVVAYKKNVYWTFCLNFWSKILKLAIF